MPAPLSYAPSRRPVTAAIGPIDQASPSSVGTPPKPRTWQETAEKYYEELGVVGFAADIVADTIARTNVIIEEQDPETGDWHETENAEVRALWNRYRNSLESPDELRAMHAWCYQVPGDGYSVTEGEPAEWFVYDRFAVEVRNDFVLIKEDESDRGRRVPRSQVQRFWLPDRRWRRRARSPMRAVLGDLRAYRSLVRYATTTAESRALLAGMQWFPEEMVKPPKGARQPGDRRPPTVIDQYTELAERGFRDDSSLASVVPFGVTGPSTAGAPKPVDIGRRLDPGIQAMKHSLLEDATRGMNLPQAWLMGGGVAEQNHWGAWLVREESWGALSPIADRIHHHDLTAVFLEPLLLLEIGLSPQQAARFRVGYDPTPVFVRDDKSGIALDALKLGVIGFKAARRETGFSEDDRPSKEELSIIVALAGRSSDADIAAAGPGDVNAAPPEEPTAAARRPARAEQPSLFEAAVAASTASPADVSELRVDEAHALISAASGNGSSPAPAAVLAAPSLAAVGQRVASLRSSAVQRVVGAANVAWRDALARAGAKAEMRARRRGAQAKAAAAAARQGQWSRSVLAQIGLTEQELLHERFDGMGEEAAAALAAYMASRAAQFSRALGIDEADLEPEDDRLDTSRAFLVAAVTALAVAAIRGESERPDIPPALVGQAFDVAERRATVSLPGTLESSPTISYTGSSDLADLGVLEEWTWQTGDPERPFDPHHEADIDGVSVIVTPDVQVGDNGELMLPEFANPDSFPAFDYYFPGDHDGCQCAWLRVPVPIEEAIGA